MEFSTIIGFLFAAMLLTLSPGPDILFVISTSISKGYRNGIFVTFGLSTGVLIHTMLAACGLLLLIKNSHTIFVLVQYFGATYLLYLAYQAWKERENHHNLHIHLNDTQQMQKIIEVNNFWKYYKIGTIMSSCNPKLIIFFLAFFPQFVDFKHPNVALHIIVLGTLFAFQATVIYSIVSIIAARLTNKLRKNIKIVKYLNISTAIVLIIIAFSILLI